MFVSYAFLGFFQPQRKKIKKPGEGLLGMELGLFCDDHFLFHRRVGRHQRIFVIIRDELVICVGCKYFPYPESFWKVFKRTFEITNTSSFVNIPNAVKIEFIQMKGCTADMFWSNDNFVVVGNFDERRNFASVQPGHFFGVYCFWFKKAAKLFEDFFEHHCSP